MQKQDMRYGEIGLVCFQLGQPRNIFSHITISWLLFFVCLSIYKIQFTLESHIFLIEVNLFYYYANYLELQKLAQVKNAVINRPHTNASTLHSAFHKLCQSEPDRSYYGFLGFIQPAVISQFYAIRPNFKAISYVVWLSSCFKSPLFAQRGFKAQPGLGLLAILLCSAFICSGKCIVLLGTGQSPPVSYLSFPPPHTLK